MIQCAFVSVDTPGGFVTHHEGTRIYYAASGLWPFLSTPIGTKFETTHMCHAALPAMRGALLQQP
jgi:hypothetical protein